MAIGSVELTHECLPKHLCMGTARKIKKTDEEGKKTGVGVEISNEKKSRWLTVARAYHCLGSLHPKAMVELPNKPNQYL